MIMKLKNIFKTVILTAMALPLLFTSCDEEKEVPEVDNLFRPVLREDPTVIGNSVLYSWYGINGSKSYTFELSRDTFKNILVSVEQIELKYSAENLKYSTKYQARIRANAENPEYTSAWFVVKEVTTGRRVVPDVLNVPQGTDVEAEQVTLSWDTQYHVTRILVESTADESFRSNVSLTATDLANGYVVVTGLTQKTAYRATIYDDTVEDEDIRNYNAVTFSTPVKMPPGATFVPVDTDLTALINAAADGDIYFLEDGFVDTFKVGMTISKSIAFYGGSVRPKIVTTAQWGVSGTVGSIYFEGIDFVSNASSSYFFNSASAFTLEKLTFSNCTFDNYTRSLFRVQGGAGTQVVEEILIDNCIVKNGCADYYVLHITNANTFKKITFSNSTFANLSRGLIRGENSTATGMLVSVESCTFYDAMNGDYVIRLDKANADVNFNKCLFTKNKGGTPTTARTLGSANAVDTYCTNDYTQNTNYSISMSPYSGAATDLFENPADLDLRIKDVNFATLKIGDPRWLP
jgi:hypothetical protein